MLDSSITRREEKKAYYLKNKNRISARAKAHRGKNIEVVKAQSKMYRVNNIEK